VPVPRALGTRGGGKRAPAEQEERKTSIFGGKKARGGRKGSEELEFSFEIVSFAEKWGKGGKKAYFSGLRL